MVCNMTSSKVEVRNPWKLEICSFSTAISSAIYNGSWQLTTISKFDQAGFLIFGLVFVSRDLEVGRNVSSEESTISPVH